MKKSTRHLATWAAVAGLGLLLSACGDGADPATTDITTTPTAPATPTSPTAPTATGASAEAYVRDAATRLVAALGQRRDLLHLMFIELVEFDGAHIPSLYAAITPHLLQLADVFTHKAGQVRPIPLPILARSFAGLFFSYYITDIMMPPDVRALMGADALDSFVDIYLRGILADTENQSPV